MDRKKWCSFVAAMAAGIGCPAAAPPGAAPSPQERHAAQCSAALESSAEALARQLRTGKKELRRPTLEALQGGLAFFASAYLDGGAAERRAQHLTAEARGLQGRMAAAELASLQNACLEEGQKLFTGADGLTRAALSRRADQRMERLAGK